MLIVTLRGKVFSGIGEGREFANLSWVRKQFRHKLGFEPYPGTLNIQLNEDNEKIGLLKRFKGIEIEPPKGFLGGRCFKALIMHRLVGAVVIPDASVYPSRVLEIIAPVNLRERFNLDDGYEVKLRIRLE